MKKYSDSFRNNKKLFLTFLLLLSASIINAQTLMRVPLDKQVEAPTKFSIQNTESEKVTSMTFGYCGDLENAVGAGTNLEHKAAIRISEETAKKLQGNTLASLLIGIGNSGTKTNVFLTYDLSEEPFYTQSATFKAQNWNTVSLTTPYIIEGKEFYIGYSITSGTIAQQAYVLGIDSEKNTGDGGYITFGKEKWMDLASQGLSNLCIRAIFEGESLPQYDLELTATKLPAKVQMNQPFSFTSTVKNIAAHSISSFNLTYSIGTSPSVTIPITPEKALDSGESMLLTFSDATSSELGTLPMTITISAPDGQTDENTANNSDTKEIKSIEQSVARKILLENFTTAQCGNCPGAHEEIQKAVDGRDDIIWVCHHAGFGVDNFTIDASKQYLWFYNSNSVYAPAMMLDRTHMTSDPGPVTGVKQAETMKTMFEDRTTDLALLSVNINKEYDEATRNLTVTISGQSLDTEVSASELYLNIFLTEDGLVGRQAGAAANYIHNHVIRTTITDTWGEELTLNQGHFTQTYAINLKSGWKAENMNIVAFVSNYDSEDPNNCIVFNTESTSVTGDDANGIEDENEMEKVSLVTTGSTVYILGDYQEAKVYDLCGKMVMTVTETNQFNLTNDGMYIIKIVENKTIHTQKVLIRK